MGPPVSSRMTPATAREDTLRAVRRALRDRQTVVLSLPGDVQDAKLGSNLEPLALSPDTGRLHPDPDAVSALAGEILEAKRPLYKRAWLWGTIGGVLAAGALATALTLTLLPDPPAAVTISPR